MMMLPPTKPVVDNSNGVNPRMNASVDENIASHEVIDWAHVTQRISLRHGLLERLTDAYHRCCDKTDSTTDLVLISGPSGVGKTFLALDLKKEVATSGGYFISGKFDQLEASWQGSSSYGPFVEAFTDNIEQILNSEEEIVISVRTTLETSMDLAERQVLHDMIPAMGKIWGEIPTTVHSDDRSSVIKGPEAESRFVRIFCLFVRSICSMDRPIVLFLDDIQWANQTEIFLLSSLAAIPLETPMSGFMLLCTLRTNEVTSEHPISGGLQEMKKLGIHINEIQVSNMVNDEVQDLIKEALHLQFKEATALSKLVYRQTDGNLLFVILLVEALNEDGILPRSGSSALDWDRINKFMKAFRSVNGLLVKTIQQLPEHAQELLKTASCLGPSFSLAVLAPMEVVDTDLLWSVLVDIEQVGLISLEEASKTGRFIHDRVQKAAYTLVPQTGRAALHLEIGRRLWKSIPRSQHNELLPLIAQQISRGVDLVYDPFEKDDLAEMFYKAGQKAAISSAFATAAIYLNMGIQLLSRHHWRDQYQLSLRLYNLAAEIAYYNGDLQRMDELVRAIINRARSFEDKLRAHFTRIYSLGSRNETEQALDESLDVLKTLGESFPSRPNSIHILVGTMRLHFLFLGKSDADIMNLSLMTDPKRVAAMRLMCIMTPYAFYTRTPLSVLLTFRMIEYTLRYGLNDMASYAFASLSIASVYAGHLKSASRFSKLALDSLAKFQNKEWKARIIVLIWSIHYPLKYPFRDSLEHLRDAHRSGLVVGDIYFSAVSASVYCGLSFAAGAPLPKLVEEMRKYRALCTQYSQFSVLASLGLQMQLCLNFMGQADDLLVLTGSVMNENEALEQMEASNHLDLVRLHISKLMLAVYLNDHSAARGLCVQLRRFDQIKNVPYSTAAQWFYEGLTAAKASSSSKTERRRTKLIIRKLKSYANLVPSNYLHRVFLVEAELLVSCSNKAHDFQTAVKKYDLAINHARDEGFVHEQALACERKAYALTRRQNDRVGANDCLEQACSLFDEWGAKAKVDKLSALLRNGNNETEHEY